VALLESGATARAQAAALGAALLGPALSRLPPGVRRLVIVPDGPLHRVPFDALRTPDGRFLVERYTLSTAPSAAVARTLRRRAPSVGTERARLLAFGDATRSGPLPAARDEVHDAARYAGQSVVRVGSDATASYLRHAPLASFDVIHFATHAYVDDGAIARTALLLGAGDGEPGEVAAGELAALHLNASLVVLSACRSARGVVVDGEGVEGLTAPLLQAGARAVVATQWAIDDRATARLVHDFYAAMATGLPVAEALRAAKLDAIRRAAPPRDWAAFTLVGDAGARVRLRTPRWWDW
jgi:CHAT domain-containing protein